MSRRHILSALIAGALPLPAERPKAPGASIVLRREWADLILARPLPPARFDQLGRDLVTKAPYLLRVEVRAHDRLRLYRSACVSWDAIIPAVLLALAAARQQSQRPEENRQ